MYNLKDGMMAWELIDAPEACGFSDRPQPTVCHPIKETLWTAYEMEKMLETVYAAMACANKTPAIDPLLNKLADEEKEHKLQILDLLKTITPDIDIWETFEARIADFSEETNLPMGNFTSQLLDSVEAELDAFSMANKLEAQTLDFYVRNSNGCYDDIQEEIFIELAEEEKSHLIHLDRLF